MLSHLFKRSRRQTKGLTVGFKITLCVLAMLTVAMSSTGLLYYRQSSSNLEDSLKANLQNVTKNNTDLITQKLDNLQWQVFNAASEQKVKGFDWKTQKDCLMEYIGRLDLQSMGVCNLDGKVTYINNAVEDISGQPFFEKAKQGGNVISDPVSSSANKEQTMVYICSPITDSNNKVKQILIGTLNVNLLSRYITNVKAGKTGHAIIIDKSGTTIASGDYRDVVKQTNVINDAKKDSGYASLSAVEKLMTNGDSGTKSYTLDGSGYWMTFAPISGTLWSFGVTVPYQEVAEPVGSLASAIILITLAFLLITAVGVTLICRFIVTKPIDKTLKQIREMSMGHIRERLNVKSKDEIGMMTMAMDEFADYIENVVSAMKKVSCGNLEAFINSKDENDEIAPAVNGTIYAVRGLVSDSKMLFNSAVEGNYDKRADDSAHSGDYRQIIKGFNDTLDKVTEEFHFYESIIDSIRLPISVNGLDKRWLFINKAMEKMSGKSKSEAVGIPCASRGSELCKGGLCAVEQLKAGNPITAYEHDGKHYRVRTSPLNNLKGEHTGYVEVIEDVTASIESHKYLKQEVERLAQKLQMISQGSFNFDHEVGEGNKYTTSERELFMGINENLESVHDTIRSIMVEFSRVSTAIIDGDLNARGETEGIHGFYKGFYKGFNRVIDVFTGHFSTISGYMSSISSGEIPPEITEEYSGDFEAIRAGMNGLTATMNGLLRETSALITASREGRLETRAETAIFSGEWKNLVEGINEMLSSFTAPVNEISAVMQNISAGSFDVAVSDSYNGDFAVLAETVNRTQSNLRDMLLDISDVLGKIAVGNLDLPKVRNYDGGYLHISDSLNQIIDSLNLLLLDIQNSASLVEAAASKVSESSLYLSHGATEQAEAIESLTGSVTLVSDKTRDNAESTQMMNEAAIMAKSHALSGNEYMSSLLESMEKINSSSSNVHKIIKTIDNISFQTNILALNASIEAARAGSYGRGFSTVADEVGRLATGSAAYVKESTEIIGGTLRSISDGTQKAGQTAQKLSDIVNGVETVVGLVENVNGALSEQSKSLGKINKEISSVSEIVQTTSVMAAENAQISSELKSEADSLSLLAFNFKLRSVQTN
jgi:methyl-accepting chemotaxis protein